MATILISYSHSDEDLRAQLEKQLTTLKRQNVIEVWHDRKIGAGEEFAFEIDKHIESDDIKGQIIGREGRNIRALEAATGVEIIVDDTPEAIIISGFDPVRREVGSDRIDIHSIASRLEHVRSLCAVCSWPRAALYRGGVAPL